MRVAKVLGILMVFISVNLPLAGCDSGPETPPMDQPIDRDTAMGVDARLRQETDELLKEGEQKDK